MKTFFLLVAICLGLMACTPVRNPLGETPAEVQTEYSFPGTILRPDSLSEKFYLIEGEIVDVQSSSIAFGYGRGDGSCVGSHAFEYVFLITADGENRMFIYPFSKGIMKTKVQITYRKWTFLSAQEFVSFFVGTSYSVPTLFNIDCDGIIVANGIKYLN